MSIGAITLGDQAGAKLAPVFADVISFAGDDSYPTGGTTGFAALVQAETGDQREILAVIGQDCGGYVPVYDPANDTLKVYFGDYDPAAAAPLAEVPNGTGLDGVTFNVLVLSR